VKPGKLNWADLNEVISSSRKITRSDVRIRSGIGEDCSVVSFGEYECVMSTDPITGASNDMGKLAVYINSNDIASCGAEPIGILVTVLAPTSATLDDIKNVMNQISGEAQKLNMEVLGGHTEVTTAVNKMVLSCTVIGKCKAGVAVSTAGAKPGDDIIVSKQLCLEGTSIIVRDYYEIIKKFLTKSEINEALSYSKYLSVSNEGRIAAKFGVNSMHDITEGGVLGALWEVSEASMTGFEVYMDKMPISEVTKKLCVTFDIDPLKFISSGSMLITTKNGEALLNLLNVSGIKAEIIGKITKEGYYLSDGEKKMTVDPPQRDELFVLQEKISKFNE